ncbi:LPXTG cell wall anchor domain-containing protein [Dactylosporangium darangshiense]|uniref:LPXTG cell wall anchor domain-containing protein n=1 Tax=Dactylosporangium darangshiense TaxID=579108 RepID=UPI0036323CE6
MSGKAECVDAAGKWKITWKLSNNYGSAVTISNVALEPADALAKPPNSIKARADGKAEEVVQFVSTAAKPAAQARLAYDAKWADGYPQNRVDHVVSAWIKLDGPCPSATPTPSKSAGASPSPSTSGRPSLPVTGSSGTLPMVGTGAVLIAGGAALVIALRRRRRVTFVAE